MQDIKENMFQLHFERNLPVSMSLNISQFSDKIKEKIKKGKHFSLHGVFYLSISLSSSFNLILLI